MRLPNSFPSFLFVLVAIAACGKQTAGSEFFGTQVLPPAGLDQVRPGMSLAEVEHLLPGIHLDPSRGYRVPSKASNVELYVMPRVDTNSIASYVYVTVAGSEGLAMLTAAWGPPDGKDYDEPHGPVWRSKATGWRATLYCRPGDEAAKVERSCDVSFYRYKPLEDFISDKSIRPPDAFAKLRIGMTNTQVKTLAGVAISQFDLVTEHLEYDNVWAHLGLVDGWLREMSFTLPPQAREVITKKWGRGKLNPDRADQESWFDPATGWRATLSGDSTSDRLLLEFANFVPLATLLDQLQDTVVGSSVAEIRTRYPEVSHSGDPAALVFPPIEWSTASASMGTAIQVATQHDSDKVEQVTLVLDPSTMYPGAKDGILYMLATKWGAPNRSDATTKMPRRVYSAHATVYELDDQLIVHLR